jgi:hypothetical protein
MNECWRYVGAALLGELAIILVCFPSINPYQARWYKNGSLPADSPGFTRLPWLVLAHEACILVWLPGR